ncbi:MULTISPECIES: fluoride efflux transporter CrcB [Bacillus]|uniref:fluoride efflux transporter CrcB n=1 Tax=Bacillus TaxID=1386 RepID=UPI001D0D13AC|nr:MULTISPECIES: fluoride efflux transporter CrcB [Bacillus]
MDNIFPVLIMISGGLGAVARYIAGVWIMKRYPTPIIPIGMLAVNVIGSFFLGVLYGMIYEEPNVLYQNPYFVTIGIGFLGAFTTFSTFSVEVVQLIKEKLYKKAGLYVAVSVIGSILSFALAFILMKI